MSISKKNDAKLDDMFELNIYFFSFGSKREIDLFSHTLTSSAPKTCLAASIPVLAPSHISMLSFLGATNIVILYPFGESFFSNEKRNPLTFQNKKEKVGRG